MYHPRPKKKWVPSGDNLMPSPYSSRMLFSVMMSFELPAVMIEPFFIINALHSRSIT